MKNRPEVLSVNLKCACGNLIEFPEELEQIYEMCKDLIMECAVGTAVLKDDFIARRRLRVDLDITKLRTLTAAWGAEKVRAYLSGILMDVFEEKSKLLEIHDKEESLKLQAPQGNYSLATAIRFSLWQVERRAKEGNFEKAKELLKRARILSDHSCSHEERMDFESRIRNLELKLDSMS